MFELKSKDMSKLKRAYLTTVTLSANQLTRWIDGTEYLVVNPPIEYGSYLVSVRQYKDGRKHIILAPTKTNSLN